MRCLEPLGVLEYTIPTDRSVGYTKLAKEASFQVRTTIANPISQTTVGSRQRIVDVARSLFSDYTYLGVSMSDIAATVGMTKASLYHHFAGKKDIYVAVLSGVHADLRAQLGKAPVDASPEGRLHAIIKSYLDFGMRERNFLNVLTGKLRSEGADLQASVAQMRAEIHEVIRPVVAQAIPKSLLKGGVDACVLTSMLTALLDGLILEHSFLGDSIDLDRVAQQIGLMLGLGGDGAVSG